MAAMSAAAAKAAAELRAKAAQGKDTLMSPRSGATTGGPKPAPVFAYNPKEGVGVAASTPRPLAGATTGGPNPATVSAYNPKEGVGVAAATPRPLAGQGNDMMMGSPATGGIAPARPTATVMKKKGGKIKAKSSYGSGGGVKSSASKRGDGIAQRGKTKGRMV